MRLFSYIVTHDTGFAPNPFFGVCTLACCKPKIRASAEVGDFIIGLAPKSRGNGVVYAMRVDEKMSFAEYWADERFGAKKPRLGTGQIVHFRGDNIYEPIGDGELRQLRSLHFDLKNKKEDSQKKKTDLGGRFVLVGHEFHYFGSSMRTLPPHLETLICGRGSKSRFEPETIHAAEAWLKEQPRGVVAPPAKWDPNDDSWREAGQEPVGPDDESASDPLPSEGDCGS